MMRPVISTIFACALSLSAQSSESDWAQARQLIEQDQSREAIELLQNRPESPERNFWLGRALLAQGLFSQATPYLTKVPEGDALYPYAAKALIYCAWESPELSMQELIAPLCQSGDASIARLAKAALLEDTLYHNSLPADAEELRQGLIKEQTDDAISQALPLLGVDILRLKGRYDEALSLGRSIDANTNLPTRIRNRAKIQLAQVHYSQAQYLKSQQMAGKLPPDENADEPAQSVEDLRGQGEETLLQFISAHPDSPILADAFFELYRHKAFASSLYLRPVLEAWIEPQELIHTKRAALALQCLYHLQAQELGEIPLSNTNLALTACPSEEASAQLLLSSISDTIKAGDLEQAEQYLKLVKQQSPYVNFLQAQMHAHRGDYEQALPIFLQCSEQTEGELRASAINNAFICALHVQNEALVEKLLRRADSDELKARLLNNRAAFSMAHHPSISAVDARSICQHYAHTPYSINAQLDLVELVIAQDINQAITRLMRLDTSKMSEWSDEQVNRYNRIRIKLALEAKNANIGNYLSPIQVIESALESSTRPAVRSELIFQYSYYLTLEDRYEDAAKALRQYADSEKNLQLRALALLRSGIAREQVNSLASLKLAIECFIDCSDIQSDSRVMALIRAAGILTRIGRWEEARNLLDPLDKDWASLRPIEQCLILSELANAWAACSENGSDKIIKALGYSKQMTELEGLSLRWQNRAHLQHALLAARFDQHEESVEHYKKIIQNADGKIHFLGRGDWYILNTAAMAAIVELLHLKQYNEAIAIAEKLTQLPANPLKDTYSQWSSYLRKARNVLGDRDIDMLFM